MVQNLDKRFGFRQDDKVALVTGASRGIGKAVAFGLAGIGYKLVLVGRDATSLAPVQAACENMGSTARCIAADLTDAGMVARLIADVAQVENRLDVLVNNAGVGGSGKVGEADLDQWDVCIQTNLVAAMHLSYHAAELLKRREGSSLITIGSVASRLTSGGGAAYAASKHGVLGFTASIFEDLREFGVKVATICPGFVDTEMVTSKNLDRTKMIAPADVAAAVVYVVTSSPRVCPTEITLRPQKSPYV